MKLSLFSVLLVLFSFHTHADFKNPSQQAKLWPEIPFLRAADFAAFNESFSKTREEARRELVAEFGDIIIPLISRSHDQAKTAEIISKIIFAFDRLYVQHKEEAHQGLGDSFESLFRAEFDLLFMQNNLNDSERRAVFVSNSEQVDFILYGNYTVLSGGIIDATLTIEKIAAAETRSFKGVARVENVMRDLAKQVFEFFQSNEYIAWINPQPKLTWIKPVLDKKVSANEADLYCKGQGARLPYVRELLQASQGTEFRVGGISALHDNATYIVADKQRRDTQYYFTTGKRALEMTGGPVHTDAAYGKITGYFWCVKGPVTQEVKFFEDLYQIIREQTERGASKNAVSAAEYLLVAFGDFGARSDYFAKSFKSVSDAMQVLQESCYIVRIPDSVASH